MEVVAKLRGHSEAVACVAASSHAALVASGGEDGLVCVHDLATQQLTTTCNLHEALAARAAAAGSGAAASSAEPEAAAALCCSPCSPSLLYAAAGRCACMLDVRAGGAACSTSCVVQSYAYSKEDVGCLAVHGNGQFLALGDDSGGVQVVDLTAGKLFKNMRQAHSNVCSSVAFRQRKPWDLLTAAMDMSVARWDFSRGKLLHRWNVSDDNPESSSEQQQQQQLFNPPMVHQLVAADSAGEDRRWARLGAAALGDGSVLLLDVEAGSEAGPKAGGSGKGRGGGRAGSGVSPTQGWSDTVDGLNMRLGSDVGSHTAAAAAVCFLAGGGVGVSPEGEGGSAAGGGGGGEGAGELLLASGGDDRMIMLWSVARALTAAAASRQQQAPAADAEGSAPGPCPLLHKARHGRKINGLCSSASQADAPLMLHVADTSKAVTCYRLRPDLWS